jgi:acyl-homoserine-lactone acylase
MKVAFNHSFCSALIIASATLAGCAGSNSILPGAGNSARYEATIERTAYGIPHVTASNLAGAAYGVAYAYAQDNLCLLADQLLTVSSERSKWFGADTPVRAGSPLPNVKSDLAYKFLLDDAGQSAQLNSMSSEAQQLVRGYVAGYNRYGRETEGARPLPCTGVQWVRPMGELDLIKLMSAQAIQSGYGAFLAGIHDAAPPAGAAAIAELQPEQSAAQFAHAFHARPDLGSNAYALGRDATESGVGMLLGNPHFPWSTTSRFYQFHMTVPNSLNVMGAALGGFPIPNIGFNNDVAWTHTVSTGRRFTLFELNLQNGTTYLMDGVATPLTKRTVTVDVRNADGTMGTRARDFYSSAHGPLVTGNGLAWNATKAFAMRDANYGNARLIDQWLQIARATGVTDIQASLRKTNGLPWVNTLAADRAGNAFYGDISVTPYVTQAKLAACSTSPTAQAFAAARNYVLDGSKSGCDWDTDAASGATRYPTADMPQLVRSDYASNSNESGWLAHPSQLLTGFSPVIGLIGREQSLRTRLGFAQISERLAGKDGRAGAKFTLDHLESIYFDNRSYAAELTVNDLIALCRTTPSAVATSGKAVDLTPACASLANWDKRFRLSSMGVPLFREFWRTARLIPSLWSVPFSATDPITTPRGLNITNPTVSAALLKALADSVEKLAANSVALDTPLGALQFVTLGGRRISIDGGDEFEGPFNKMTALGLTPAGYTPIVSGSSYLQAVTFDANGPVARGLLTYSQSTNPSSPHAFDQTELHATGKWFRYPFTRAEIAADPALRVTTIRE